VADGDKKKVCPLRLAGASPSIKGSQKMAMAIARDKAGCIEAECALYHERAGQCAFYLVGDALLGLAEIEVNRFFPTE